MRVFHGDILKSIQSELMTLQPSSKLPWIICSVQQDRVWNMKMWTWPSFKLPWFITARITRESKWVYEEISVMGDCKMIAGSDEPFLKPFNHKKSASLFRCCRVDKSSTLIPKSLSSLNDFQDGNVCLFLLFCAIFCVHLYFIVIMSFNWLEIWVMCFFGCIKQPKSPFSEFSATFIFLALLNLF